MIARRSFALAGIAATVAGSGAQAQPAVRSIGYLNGRSSAVEQEIMAAFRRGLSETGFVEGGNLKIHYRWADGRYDQLPAMAAELLNLGVSVITTTGGPQVARIARAASPAIPVVFSSGSDPVEDGLVRSLNRPGGNMTGIVVFTTSLGPKRLEILAEVVPGLRRVGFMVNRNSDTAVRQLAEVEQAARAVGVDLVVVHASVPNEIVTAFTTLSERRADALLMSADLFYQVQSARLVALAAGHRLPTIWEWSHFVHEGGLISYSVDRTDSFIACGILVGRILNGARAGELPIARATKFDLTINLRTARDLGITLPASLLARADEVIE